MRLIETDPPGGVIAPDGSAQRTAYLEQTVGDPPEPPEFAVEFEFVTRAYVHDLDPANTSNQTTSLSDALEFTVAP